MKKAKIEEWEFRCEKCKGKGTIILDTSNDYNPKCPECQGTGKLDWIENIVGKRSEDIQTLMNRLSEEMAKHFADKIDKEIIESIEKEAEHDIKIKNGGNLFDYGKIC